MTGVEQAAAFHFFQRPVYNSIDVDVVVVVIVVAVAVVVNNTPRSTGSSNGLFLVLVATLYTVDEAYTVNVEGTGYVYIVIVLYYVYNVPVVARIGQCPVDTDHVADVLVECVLLPAVVDQFFLFRRQVFG